MDTRIRVRHAGVVREVSLSTGMDPADLHGLLKSAFPSAGVLAGLEDDRGVLHTLSSVCQNVSVWRDRSFALAVAMPHVELDFTFGDASQRMLVHYDADPSDIAGLLHTLFDLPQGALITGVRCDGVAAPLSALCDNPPLYRGKQLELVMRDTHSRRGSGSASASAARADEGALADKSRNVRFNMPSARHPAAVSGSASASAPAGSAATAAGSGAPAAAATATVASFGTGTAGIASPPLPTATPAGAGSAASLAAAGSAAQSSGAAGGAPTSGGSASVAPAPLQRGGSFGRTGSTPSGGAMADLDSLNRDGGGTLLVSGGKVDKVKRKVKVYRLNGSGEWDDMGTGIAVCGTGKSGGAAILVLKDDAAGSVVLKAPITRDVAFVREQPTLVVWDDTALSFQDLQGCDEVWQQVQRLQGRTSA